MYIIRNYLRLLVVALAFLSLAGCGREEGARNNKAVSGQKKSLLERYSGATPQGMDEAGNRCYNDYPDAVLVNVPPDNNLARYFRLPEGVVKVVVTLGKTGATFLLEKKGTAPVKLYTSRHFPQCLSDDGNFTLQEGGDGFRYDNNYLIRFDLHISPAENGYIARLDYAGDMQYGIEVRRCSDCE